jgi:hypothetical protein
MLRFVKHRLPLLVTLVAALVVAPDALAQTGLLDGRILNQTGVCGPAEPLGVQIMGNDMSPRISVPTDAPVAVSLPRGMYSVAVLRADGSLLEETNTLLMSPGFVLTVGCAGIPTTAAPANAAPPAASLLVPVRLVNTTGDCGDPKSVEFLVDRRSVGSVADRGQIKVSVPADGTVVDVLADGRRVMTTSVSRPRAGQVLAFGCTFPDAAGSRDGVPVAFENTTDQCADPAARRALTLWVDGLPVTGLTPGKKTAVRFVPGHHEFEVRVGWSRERVVRGAKDVQASFRIHYGCGR